MDSDDVQMQSIEEHTRILSWVCYLSSIIPQPLTLFLV